MKSSKYTQANSPNDNDFRDYQNMGATIIPQNERNLNQSTGTRTAYAEIQARNVASSEEMLIYENYLQGENVFQLQPSCSSPTKERNANANVSKYPGQEFELLCNCAVSDVTYPTGKFRVKEHHNSEQNITQNFCSMTKIDNSASQCSLDKKSSQAKPKPKVGYANEPKTRSVPSKRMQSPEIINIHRGPNNVLYDVYGPENCAIKSYGYDRELKCDDYGFRREQSFKRTSIRSVGVLSGFPCYDVMILSSNINLLSSPRSSMPPVY